MNGENTEKKRAVSPINGQPVPNGRTKGVPNKATMQFKEALNNLLEHSAPNMVQWLEQVDSPEKRFDILSKFAEYIYPKLGRAEIDIKSESTVSIDVTQKIQALQKLPTIELQKIIDENNT